MQGNLEENLEKRYKTENGYSEWILLYIPSYFFFFCNHSYEVFFVIYIIKWPTFYSTDFFYVCFFFSAASYIETDECLGHSSWYCILHICYISLFYHIFYDIVPYGSGTTDSWYIIHRRSIRIANPYTDNSILMIWYNPIISKICTRSSFDRKTYRWAQYTRYSKCFCTVFWVTECFVYEKNIWISSAHKITIALYNIFEWELYSSKRDPISVIPCIMIHQEPNAFKKLVYFSYPEILRESYSRAIEWVS